MNPNFLITDKAQLRARATISLWSTTIRCPDHPESGPCFCKLKKGTVRVPGFLDHYDDCLDEVLWVTDPEHAHPDASAVFTLLFGRKKSKSFNGCNCEIISGVTGALRARPEFSRSMFENGLNRLMDTHFHACLKDMYTRSLLRGVEEPTDPFDPNQRFLDVKSLTWVILVFAENPSAGAELSAGDWSRIANSLFRPICYGLIDEQLPPHLSPISCVSSAFEQIGPQNRSDTAPVLKHMDVVFQFEDVVQSVELLNTDVHVIGYGHSPSCVRANGYLFPIRPSNEVNDVMTSHTFWVNGSQPSAPTHGRKQLSFLSSMTRHLSSTYPDIDFYFHHVQTYNHLHIHRVFHRRIAVGTPELKVSMSGVDCLMFHDLWSLLKHGRCRLKTFYDVPMPLSLRSKFTLGMATVFVMISLYDCIHVGRGDFWQTPSTEVFFAIKNIIDQVSDTPVFIDIYDILIEDKFPISQEQYDRIANFSRFEMLCMSFVIYEVEDTYHVDTGSSACRDFSLPSLSNRVFKTTFDIDTNISMKHQSLPYDSLSDVVDFDDFLDPLFNVYRNETGGYCPFSHNISSVVTTIPGFIDQTASYFRGKYVSSNLNVYLMAPNRMSNAIGPGFTFIDRVMVLVYPQRDTSLLSYTLTCMSQYSKVTITPTRRITKYGVGFTLVFWNKNKSRNVTRKVPYPMLKGITTSTISSLYTNSNLNYPTVCNTFPSSPTYERNAQSSFSNRVKSGMISTVRTRVINAGVHNRKLHVYDLGSGRGNVGKLKAYFKKNLIVHNVDVENRQYGNASNVKFHQLDMLEFLRSQQDSIAMGSDSPPGLIMATHSLNYITDCSKVLSVLECMMNLHQVHGTQLMISYPKPRVHLKHVSQRNSLEITPKESSSITTYNYRFVDINGTVSERTDYHHRIVGSMLDNYIDQGLLILFDPESSACLGSKLQSLYPLSQLDSHLSRYWNFYISPEY